MMVPIAGVDGCPGGWICVSKTGADAAPSVRVIATFAGLAASLAAQTVIAVDMPIGLPDRTGLGGRGAEQAVRPFLKARQSSVFSVPSRAAVYAEIGPFENETARLAAHKRASDVALATSEPPRKISIQAFGLFAKIRELDAWLREDISRCARVFESHPEFAFTILNGGEPMALPKKIKGKGNPEGMAERRGFLATRGFDQAFLNQSIPRGANADDFLDACVMLLVAGRLAKCEAKPYPSCPAHDSFNLPIAIHA
jgi:predicted RNase H-like nuclease